MKSHTLVLFFLLCRYLHCSLQAGNDSDTMWHFLGLQCAGLNETSYCSFPAPWALSAQQMSKAHFRLGWEGEGKVDVTAGLTFLTPLHAVRATVQPPQPWHFAFSNAAPVGTGGWCLVFLQRDCFLLTWEMGSSSWPWAPKSQSNHSHHTQVKCPLTGRQEEMEQRLWLWNSWEKR